MLAISKREYSSMIGVAKPPRRPNKHSQNDNKQEYAKKQHYFCIKQNKYISKKHREKKEKTRTTNLNDFRLHIIFAPPEHKANAFVLRPSRPSMHCVNVFSWRKNRNTHPGVRLAPIKSWQFFLKKKLHVAHWLKLMSTTSTCGPWSNGQLGVQ